MAPRVIHHDAPPAVRTLAHNDRSERFSTEGLATEAARAAVKLGFERYGFPRIVPLIHPENVASARVAEKIGMKHERDVSFKEFGAVAVYALKAEEFVIAKPSPPA